jgi:hypothetical protein
MLKVIVIQLLYDLSHASRQDAKETDSKPSKQQPIPHDQPSVINWSQSIRLMLKT